MPSSLVMKKGLPYYRFLFYQTLKLIETGEYNLVLSREHGREMSCDSGRKKGSPIGLEKLSILFIMLFSGIIFSCLICCLESIHRRVLPTKNGLSSSNVDVVERVATAINFLKVFETTKNQSNLQSVSYIVEQLLKQD
jgi:hypothetical protein